MKTIAINMHGSYLVDDKGKLVRKCNRTITDE